MLLVANVPAVVGRSRVVREEGEFRVLIDVDPSFDFDPRLEQPMRKTPGPAEKIYGTHWAVRRQLEQSSFGRSTQHVLYLDPATVSFAFFVRTGSLVLPHSG